MFDKSLLKDVLEDYKKDFATKQWPDEKYKWEAVKWFQDNWDVNASDFADMLIRSLAKTNNLLASANNFPAAMIQNFAKAAPEEVRGMFIDLFDEGKEVFERIESFKVKSASLLEEYGNGAKQHFQNENSISTYLWLRYPDKYYIYKFSEIEKIVSKLKSDYSFRRGAYADNIRNFLKLYNEICSELKQDEELMNLLKSQLTESCYPDPELRTLTIDVGFYISRSHNKTPSEEWRPRDYSPGLSVDDWVRLLEDRDVFYPSSLEIMKRMKDYGGQATCTQLSIKYGETKNFYNTGSSTLAKRIAKKTGCPLMDSDSENFRWWPILYVGKNAGNDDDGSFIWKLRDELAEALDRIDLSDVKLYVSPGPTEEHGYWWLNANPRIWSFSDIAVGEVQSYTLYNENGNKRRIFQNFLDAKAGDLIIGYEANPIKKIVALCKVSVEHDGEKIYFEKVEGLASPIDYQTLRGFSELERMEFFVNPNGSLFKLTKGEYDFILDLIREENPIRVAADTIEKYTKEDFLDEVYMTEEKYERLISVLKNKKNIILQGAPGVGKTFVAKRLAYSIMGEKDENRIEFVQFHQNYSYEDFIMGYKPVENGFEMKYGVFYRFCQKAANEPDKDYFFIIDEINRGNMSKIFGELLMLIENDYRGTKATLAYNGLSFSVPERLHIIGTMNTADRSLAMIDYALRRRFSFFNMETGFDSEGFIRYQEDLANETFDDLILKIKDLNKEIAKDKSLGTGFCIGHSYFCGVKQCTEEWMKAVVEYEILPMLSEYWFDDQTKLQYWENILNGVFQ